MALQNPDQARIAMENGATVAGGAELIDKVKVNSYICCLSVSFSFVCVFKQKRAHLPWI